MGVMLAALDVSGQVARLVDFGFLPGQPAYSLFSIDPSVGTYSPIVSAVTTSGMYGGGQALDSIGQRFFFLKPDTSELVTVNLQNQQITHVTVPICCAFLQYDIVSGRLLAFGSLPGQPGFSVFSISPTTGAYTPIVSAVTTSGMYGGGQALDPSGQRFFFLKPDTSELVTVDLQTHQVSSVTEPTCCGFLSFDFGTLPVAVPVGSPENMILLAVLLLTIGIVALRK